MPINTRRTFLKLLSALGIGAAIPNVAHAKEWPLLKTGETGAKTLAAYGPVLLSMECTHLVGIAMLGHGYYFARRVHSDDGLDPTIPLGITQRRTGKYVIAANLLEVGLPDRLINPERAPAFAWGNFWRVSKGGPLMGTPIFLVTSGAFQAHKVSNEGPFASGGWNEAIEKLDREHGNALAR